MVSNLESEDWFETWRLRAIASSVSAELKARFDLNEFYSPEQVLAACDARNVTGYSRVCALAMFVQPGQLHDILQDYGISDHAEEVRKMIARKISYSATSGVDCSAFSFHHIDLGTSHDFGSSSSISGDFGSDSGGDSGGF